MNLVVVMLGFLATITLVLSYAVNDYTAQKSVLKNSQLSTALQQAIVFTNTEFNNYKLYSPNTATYFNNLPDTFTQEGDDDFKNGFNWQFTPFNMPGQFGGNQLSCGNNWPSSSYLYVTITPPPGFTQLDARKLASALQNNNWNFQGYQASAPIQVNVGYIDQNGILQPYGYYCSGSITPQPNTIVEVIGPMT